MKSRSLITNCSFIQEQKNICNRFVAKKTHTGNCHILQIQRKLSTRMTNFIFCRILSNVHVAIFITALLIILLANTDWTIHGSFPPIPIVLPFKLKGGEGKHFSELDLPYASIHIPYPYMTTCNKGLIIFYIRCLIFQRIYCTQSKNFTSYNAIFQVVSIWMRSAILQLKFMKCTTYFFHFWRWIAI